MITAASSSLCRSMIVAHASMLFHGIAITSSVTLGDTLGSDTLVGNTGSPHSPGLADSLTWA